MNDIFSSKEFKLSIISHVLILIAFIILSKVNLSFLKVFSDKQKNDVQTFVRVDLVEMPRYTLQELKKIHLNHASDNIEESSKANAKREDQTIQIDQKKGPSKSFLSFVKGQSKKVKAKAPVKKEAKKIHSGELKKLLLAGNKVSQGLSKYGTEGGNKDEFKFMLDLVEHIRPYWKIPSYLKESRFNCRIRIYLDREGNLLKTSLEEPSGSSEYDSFATQAIKQSSPFPIFSKFFIKKAVLGEIVLGFPL